MKQQTIAKKLSVPWNLEVQITYPTYADESETFIEVFEEDDQGQFKYIQEQPCNPSGGNYEVKFIKLNPALQYKVSISRSTAPQEGPSVEHAHVFATRNSVRYWKTNTEYTTNPAQATVIAVSTQSIEFSKP